MVVENKFIIILIEVSFRSVINHYIFSFFESFPLTRVMKSLPKPAKYYRHWLSVGRCDSSKATAKWQSVVGLEIHAQLDTKSKLFSGAQNVFGGVVNNCVALFDAAIPGTLPVLNRQCVQLGVLAALALSCKVNEVSMFDRKHYFYADLPSGYQITQQRAPLASDGELYFQVYTPGIHKKPYKKLSKIKQIQLEQDSGKSLHDSELKRSLVDLNRAGAPLIELVFEPDLQDGEEAAALVKELVLILQRLGACSGRMEEGALRVDANVSLHKSGEPLGTRTEIKNIGSIRGVASAIRYEIQRQRAVLDGGGSVGNETRSWDALAKQTVPMRDKEVVQDYRYMPEPNLPPLRLNTKTKIDTNDVLSVPFLLDQIPELPEQTRTKLIDHYKLKPEKAIQLVNETTLLEYFIKLSDPKKDSTKIANFLVNDLLTVLNKNNIDVKDCPFTSEQLNELLNLLFNKEINIDVPKMVLHELLDVKNKERNAKEIVVDKGWLMVTDDDYISSVCKDVIENNPKIVLQYKQGKVKVFKALLGIVAMKTQNKIDMSSVAVKLKEMLKN